MKIRDLLPDDQRNELHSLTKTKTSKNEQLKPIKFKEKLSTKEWKDIMGVNRDTYKRVNGKVKRK